MQASRARRSGATPRYHARLHRCTIANMHLNHRPARWLLMLAASILLAACAAQPAWQLDNVRGHLPDLKFSLTSDAGTPVTASNFRGKVVLMYFGYTHCPDVCPLTLVHLHTVLQRMGKAADDVRVLFVTVDPARDSVAVLHEYVTAFDPRIVGLTGTPAEIGELAKRYRAYYKPASPAKDGAGYEVTHSSATYIFDRTGHARLLATPGATNDAIEHDLELLVQQPQ